MCFWLKQIFIKNICFHLGQQIISVIVGSEGELFFMQPGQAVLLHPSRIFTWQEFWHVSWEIGDGIGPWAEFKCGTTQSEVVPPRGEDEGRPCVRGRARRMLRSQRNARLAGAKGWAQGTKPRPRAWEPNPSS